MRRSGPREAARQTLQRIPASASILLHFDIDVLQKKALPAAYFPHTEGMSLSEIDSMLNKQSGLLGISGLTGDMRELLEEEAENGDRRARLAIDVFCRRVRRYIGAYLAETGGTDALIFTGGIGENAPSVRERICQGLEFLGVTLDKERNGPMKSGASGLITTDGAPLPVYVIPTDEELLIARDTVRVVG